MNFLHVRAILILFTCQLSMHSMDLPTTENNAFSIDSAIKAIEDKLNAELPLENSLGILYMFDKPLFWKVINIIQEHDQNNTITGDRIIDTLYQKNYLVKYAIDHYVNLVFHTFNQISPNQLDRAYNPTIKQIRPELEGIKDPMINYFIAKAQNKAEENYSIILKFDASIIDFDISADTHQIIVSSGEHLKRHKLELYDLTILTKKELDEKHKVLETRFSTNGTVLATIILDNMEKPAIKLWNLEQEAVLHTIPLDTVPLAILPTNTPSLWGIINFQDSISTQRSMMILSLENQTPRIICSMEAAPIIQHCHARFIDQKNYQVFLPGIFSRTKLQIVKNNCSHIALCKSALERVLDSKSLRTIKTSQPYGLLTEYEKKAIINPLLADKKKRLGGNFLK
jgi:hypothetical protein